MQSKRLKQPPLVQWAVASRPRSGSDVCGDLEVVKAFPGGTLVGVVDGLGAAEDAAATARTAAATLMRYAKEPLTSLVKRCHKNLMMSRGAVLTLASFSAAEGQMSWLGIGNVAGLLLRANPQAKPAYVRLRLFGGVVGYYLPLAEAASVSIEPSDTLILATHGIRSDFERDLDGCQPPQMLADAVLERSFKGTEDALVLAARYMGTNHEDFGR